MNVMTPPPHRYLYEQEMIHYNSTNITTSNYVIDTIQRTVQCCESQDSPTDQPSSLCCVTSSCDVMFPGCNEAIGNIGDHTLTRVVY